MKKFKIILMVLVLILLTGCTKGSYKKISFKEYEEMIKNKETFVLEVMKKDCSACEMFKPTITKFAKDYDLTIYYIDAHDLSQKEFETFGVDATPTVIFYNKGEEETVASRLIGAVSEDKLLTKFKANGFIK